MEKEKVLTERLGVMNRRASMGLAVQTAGEAFKRASEIGDPQAPTVRSRLPVPARRQTRAESLLETTTEAATPDNGQIKDAGTSSLPKRLPVFPTLNAGNPNNVSWPSISLSVNASHSILMSNVLDHSTTSTTSAKISCQMGVPGLSVEDLKI